MVSLRNTNDKTKTIYQPDTKWLFFQYIHEVLQLYQEQLALNIQILKVYQETEQG